MATRKHIFSQTHKRKVTQLMCKQIILHYDCACHPCVGFKFETDGNCTQQPVCKNKWLKQEGFQKEKRVCIQTKLLQVDSIVQNPTQVNHKPKCAYARRRVERTQERKRSPLEVALNFFLG